MSPDRTLIVAVTVIGAFALGGKKSIEATTR